MLSVQLVNPNRRPRMYIIHMYMQISPSECLLGFECKLPPVLKNKVEPVYNADDYCFELKYKLQKCHELARKHLIAAKHQSKIQYDKNVRKPRTFSPGDIVYEINEERKGKLDDVWLGPYKVISSKGVNTTIKQNKRIVVVHNNRLKHGA